MQVTNSATIVDYFPEAFIAEADENKGMKVVVKRFIRRVHFRATGQKSYSVVLGIEAKYDWQARIAKGATVTNFNTDKMPRAEYMPCFC
jgi:hypothetical protein|tara:strand:+ start:4750 stop:5016 length:267 start_codon:yes stop_codon:yes gene_type:complete